MARRLVALALLGAQAAARSDVPEQFYRLLQSGKPIPEIPFLPKPLPTHLTKRLKEIEFSSLSLPLKHALLWDSGLIISGNTDQQDYVQVKVPCEASMNDIFLTADEISEPKEGNCSLVPCNAQILHFATFNCSTKNVEALAQCGVVQGEPVTATSSNPIWSEDGEIDQDVYIRIYKKPASGSGSATLYTIQEKRMNIQDDKTLKDCPNKATFIIPCRELGASNVTVDGQWCNPVANTFVDLWISQEAMQLKAKDKADSDSAKIHTFISLFAIAAAGCCCSGFCLWRRRRRAKTARSSAGVPSRIGGSSEEMQHAFMTNQNHHHMITTDSENTGVGFPNDRVSSFTSNELEKINNNFCERSRDLAEFCDDQELMMKRISYASLHFSTLIARGANGEVWRGEYAGQDVAIKRMLRDKQGEIMFMEVFAREIRLASTLEHPNIVRFIGLSWRSLSELCMVSEFMPSGDLAHYLLSKESRNLSWENQKMSLALDIANALVYLHSLMPVIIHRDLKSLNVLLNENFEAKLSDFGLSRERSFEETMTSGVGTMLWTAPEVLRGDRYTERADIYSYGVVLSEIDTCLPPYSLNEEVARAKQKSAQLLPLIRNGQIKPQFRPSVPKPLHELALACLDYVPEKRPNAMQIVYILRSKVMPTLV